MKSVFDAVRQASLPGIWSVGVKLAREGHVTRTSAGGGEATFRVRMAGRAVAPTVTLYLEDAEWTCDCSDKADPCSHVAAAVIAGSELAEARTSGVPRESPAAARIEYRLGRRDRSLGLERVIVHDGGREEPVTRGLASLIARGAVPAGLSPTHDDLEIDRLLPASARDVVPLAALRPVLAALSSAQHVTFEGKPVKISGDAIGPVAAVEDAPGGGFELSMRRDSRIAEVVARGVVRAGETLHPIALGDTTGYLLENLPLSRHFAAENQAELVNDVLPQLSKRLDVTISSARLPRGGLKVEPRIDFDLSHAGHTLSVLPTLVYGDPPIARVDAENLVSLGTTVPERKREAERELLRRLREDLNLKPGRRVDFDGPDAARFAARIREFQARTGDAARAALWRGPPLRARVQLDGDTFDVVFEAEGAGGEGEPAPRAETAAVLQAFRDGVDLVPLEGGAWARIPADFLARHGDLVLDLLASRDAAGRVARAALPQLGALCTALDLPPPADLSGLAPLLEGFTTIPRAPRPAGLNATLRHYQEHAVDWLAFLRSANLGAILADDMGLGKTLETLAALVGRTLVVCPRSVVHNWVDEMARFRPDLRAAVYHGAGRAIDASADVLLTTYAVLRLDVDALSAVKWDAVVLDEAQAIKNGESQTAQAAFRLDGRFRVALSGTPVENRLEELWSIMHFANPGLLGGRAEFQSRYSSKIANGDPGAAARLRAKIRPFVLRRAKRDVVPELPPRTDVVIHVELDEAERAAYDAVRAATKKDIVDRLAKGTGTLAALEALLRLRQAACHTGLLPGRTAPTSSKVERLVESLEEAAADGHKALVFSQWTSFLDLIEPALREAGIAFTRLDGSTKDRGAVVAHFQSAGGPPVLLVSLKAGGTGLNLTAADHVFLLDPWWNPAVEDQAADRAHRIGQERPVLVHRMVGRDTVEERLLLLQDKKRRLADAALAGADQAGGITRQDLMDLLD